MEGGRALAALGLMTLGVLAGCGQRGSAGVEGDADVSAARHPSNPALEFVIPGGDNTIPYFGHEGAEVEREEASATVEAWDRARAAGDWIRDCSHLTRAYIDNLVTDAEGVSKGDATTCVEALKFFGPVASGAVGRTTTGPIDSLRVSGDRGYALYRGRGRQDWIVPVEKEHGAWRVAVSAPINRRE
jgi:hypothetical protein